jgi:hypothetical protein
MQRQITMFIYPFDIVFLKLQMNLKLYNPNASQSASTVLCVDKFCWDTNNGMPRASLPHHVHTQ